MARKTNKELLNAIHEDCSAEFKERVPVMETERDGERVIKALDQYPSLKNEFINTLVNKIFTSVVMNKVWKNPLAMLKKGTLEYGMGIEQVFADLVEKKNFSDKYGSTDESSLIREEKPSVKVRYLQKNFAYKYKTTLSNQRLRAAFMNANGVANMVDSLVVAMMNSAEHEEFKDMLDILVRETAVNGVEADGTGSKQIGVIKAISALGTGAANKDCIVEVAGGDAKALTIAVKNMVSEMGFITNKYNLAGAMTFSNANELVLFVTSQVAAELDVEVLSAAFNVSAAEMNVRIIKVPNATFKEINANWGGSTASAKTPVAILMDSDMIQQWDTITESGSFANVEKMSQNLFVHRHGISMYSDFAQCAVFVK